MILDDENILEDKLIDLSINPFKRLLNMYILDYFEKTSINDIEDILTSIILPNNEKYYWDIAKNNVFPIFKLYKITTNNDLFIAPIIVIRFNKDTLMIDSDFNYIYQFDCIRNSGLCYEEILGYLNILYKKYSLTKINKKGGNKCRQSLELTLADL